MTTTGVNSPRTPVTKGSMCTAIATVPNVCKMPGPPAPFIPTPLPNIGMSSNSLQGASKKVKIEGQVVAIKGASFKSVGDVASQGTGGGIVSSTTQGATKFVTPGSLDTKAEGKAIHLLGDATTNNNSNPPNAATVAVLQAPAVPGFAGPLVQQAADDCNESNEWDAPVAPPELDPVQIASNNAAKQEACAEEVDNASEETATGVGYDSNGEPVPANNISNARQQAARDVAAAKAAGQPTDGVYAQSFNDAGGAPAVVVDVVVVAEPNAEPTSDNVVEAVDVNFDPASQGNVSKAQAQTYNDTVGQPPTVVAADGS